MEFLKKQAGMLMIIVGAIVLVISFLVHSKLVTNEKLWKAATSTEDIADPNSDFNKGVSDTSNSKTLLITSMIVGASALVLGFVITAAPRNQIR